MDKTAKPGPPRTLIQAHEALVRIRPKRDASLAAWLAYHEQSATLYAELADIDRGTITNACTGRNGNEKAPRKLPPGSQLSGPRNDAWLAPSREGR